MVEVRDLSGWSRLPAWIQCLCLAGAKSTLDRLRVHSDDVALVTCIAFDAEESVVSMVVQITPVLTIVTVRMM
jgi:hypothetical protein